MTTKEEMMDINSLTNREFKIWQDGWRQGYRAAVQDDIDLGFKEPPALHLPLDTEEGEQPEADDSRDDKVPKNELENTLFWGTDE